MNRGIEDQNRGWLESKVHIVKKWGILGLAAVTYPLWQPYVDKYFDSKTYEQTYKAVADYHSEMHTMSDEVLIRVVRKIVLVQSIDKVAYIERRLIECGRVTTCKAITDWQRTRVAKDVLNELKSQSNVYITLLNAMPEHSRIGKIGNYIARTFPMTCETGLMPGYNFMADVNDIMFMKDISIPEKGDAIMAYMKDIQGVYFDRVYKKMRGK